MSNFPTEYIREIRTFISDATIKTAFSDDFDNAPIRWKIWGNGSGYAVTQDTTKALSGTHSLKMITQSSTPAVSDYVAITGFFPLPVVPDLVELRSSFVTPSDPTTFNLDFTLAVYTTTGILAPSNAPNYMVVWRGASSQWQYYNTAGAFVASGNTKFQYAAGENYWNFLSLKTLPQVGEYVNLQISDQVVDLSGIVPQGTALGTNSLIKVQVFFQTLAAAQKEIYLDNLSIIAT